MNHSYQFDELVASLGLDLAPATSGGFTLGDAAAGKERTSIPYGEHRPAVLQHGLHLRRLGLTVIAALPMLQAFIESGVLEGYDPSRPFIESDLRAMLGGVEHVASGVSRRRNEAVTLSIERLNLRDLRTVRFERVTWFEQHMIPLAELTLVNGDGGIGKTTATLDLIARSSAARPMPGGLLHDRPLRCLIIAEEDRHGLLRARLDVRGANHDNIRLIESVGEEREYVTFPRHARALRDTILSGGWDVVMIDALLNHLDDDVNASRPQDMRRALRPLVDVAHETGATILAIRHIGKGAGPASTRGFGSAEARNLCRSELTVAPHPDVDAYPGLIVVALSKWNLTPVGNATMAFRLASVDVTDDDGLPTTIAQVDWMQVPPTISADELLERPDTSERSRLAAAADCLRDALAAGPRRSSEVLAEGNEAGHKTATIYRAREKAGVISEQRGFPAKAYWFLKKTQVFQNSPNGEPENADKPATSPGLFPPSEVSQNSLRVQPEPLTLAEMARFPPGNGVSS